MTSVAKSIPATLGIGQSGVDLIFRERLRQIHEKRYDAAHDDTRADGSLIDSAKLILGDDDGELDPDLDCGDEDDWAYPLAKHVHEKYADDPIRRLAIAGAMIAAEIDRLVRARK